MSAKYGFKVCRVCLTPEPADKLKSMLEGLGEMADCFQLVSGCSISYDRGKHEALICPKCSDDVKAAFDLRRKISRIDVYYCQERRDKADEEEFEREQTVVEEPAETVSQVVHPQQFEVSNAPSGSRSSSGAGSPRMTSQVQQGVTDPKSIGAAAKPNSKESLKCHVCDKFFSSFRNLRKHIEVVHEKIKKFACDFCATKCHDKSNIRVHIVRMHMSPDSCSQIKCDYKGCTKSFLTTHNLSIHKKSHSNERKFRCSTCQKTLKFSHVLKDHQQSHSSERPFKCPACLKTFKYSQHLKRHQKNHCTSKA